MRNASFALVAFSALVFSQMHPADAGQYSMNPRTPGVKYCPAPGADNSEFLHSYWAVDAKTGEMTKVTATDHPSTPAGYDTNQQQEEVLFVAPNVSVENRYVPYPGAAAQEPPPAFRQASLPVQEPAPSFRQASLPIQEPAPTFRQASLPPPPVQMPAPAPASRPRRQAGYSPAPAAPIQQPQVNREQYRQQYQLQAPVSQTAATAVPKASSTVASRPDEVKNMQEKLKNSANKRVSSSKSSKSHSEKLPWWRHIWRN